MNPSRQSIDQVSRDEPDDESPEDFLQTAWQWFAVGLLLFCWIAEASMCADRGF